MTVRTQSENTAEAMEPIAVVGMSCRVPGADDVGEYWRNLIDGVESVQRTTLEEQAALGVSPSELNDPDFVPVSAVLRDAGSLDAAMFGMTPSEAELRDPQHRLFLELAYTALEDAACDPARYDGVIGVYAGTGEDGYQWRQVRRNAKALARAGTVGMSVNSHPDYVATFTSYKLDLRGPSLTVHTACSTSLVAVHLACEALRNGECEMALAGGVNLELPLGHGYVYVDGSVTSKDGHCRPFDANATGTIWSSGGAVLALKPLSAARADGDDIRALIIGNAVNNDGSVKAGFTAPSVAGQSAVIAQALSAADVDARSIGFVEAHGTGTALGDPLEVAALTGVYRGYSADRGWCAVGSVKSNVGHLGPAAGAAGLIKAVLAVRHGLIPPTLNYESPNSEINFDVSPFFVNTSPLVWTSGNNAPRRAAISSFGMGGTNAHLVVEQPPAPPQQPAGDEDGPFLLRLSARTKSALKASAARLADHLDSTAAEQAGLGRIAATLADGRRRLPERLAVPAADRADAVAALRDHRRWSQGTVPASDAPPRIVLLYPGQGSQYPGMGSDLFATQKVYREAVEACCDLLDPRIAETVRAALTGSGLSAEVLERTEIAQPALFVVEFALADLWASWGVTQTVSLGHSIGEFVAATRAGVFRLADALALVSERGRLTQALEPGAMLAVSLSEQALRAVLPAELDVCAVNGPESCVVGGRAADVEEFAKNLRAKRVLNRRLRTSHAFHSRMMEPAVEAFREMVAQYALAEPRARFVSGTIGEWITDAEATDPAYWARHLREPVRFGAAVATLLAEGEAVFLECGPGRQLSGLVKMQRDPRAVTVQVLPSSDEAVPAAQKAADAAAKLWTRGVENRAFVGSGARVALPTYPWERAVYWVEPDSEEASTPRPEAQPAASRTFEDWFAVPTWRQRIAPALEPGAGDVLLLGEDRDGLAARLTALGRRVEVRALTSARQEDFEALFKAWEGNGGLPRHIVHLGAAHDPSAETADEAWKAIGRGFFGVLALVRALAVFEPTERIQLDIVTRGTQDVVGSDVSHPEHATLAGAVKVLPLEYSWLEVRQVDLDPALSGRARRVESARLAEELCAPGADSSPDSAERMTALRGGRSWERTFTELRTRGYGRTAGDTLVKQNGVYLITGGLGGVGLTLAEELAVRFKARLVLVTRSGLPASEQWDSPGLSSTQEEAVEAVRRMRKAGGQVKVIAADIADVAALRSLRTEVLGEYGHLDGIVHAAGVAGGGMTVLRERAAMEEVLRPKVLGTLALHQVFGDLPLDFVVLCSSVTAISGAIGQADYCAANAFLDAFAAATDWDTAVLSVNWGGWSQVGMAARADTSEAYKNRHIRPHGALVHANLVESRSAKSTDGPCWARVVLAPNRHWPLAEHRIDGVPVMPATGQIELIRSAFEELFDKPSSQHAVELRDVVFLERLAVRDAESLALDVVFTPTEHGYDFATQTEAGGRSRVYSRGTATWIVPEDAARIDIAAIRARCGTERRLERKSSRLVEFGPHWGALQDVHVGDGEELASLIGVEGVQPDALPWVLQPALLDEALATGWQYHDEYSYLPFSYGRMIVRGALPTPAWSYVRVRPDGRSDTATADIVVCDEAGIPLVEVQDFVMRRVDPAGMRDASEPSLPADPTQARGAGIRARITPSEGAAAFRRLLEADLGRQTVVSAVSIQDLIVAARRSAFSLEEEKAEPAPSAEPLAAPGQRRGRAEQGIAEIWAELLGIGTDKIGDDEDFFEKGGDSLVAVQMVSMVRRKFGVKLPMRRFFAEPTVAGLARTIAEIVASTSAAQHAS